MRRIGPRRKDFIEVTTAGILFFILKNAAEAALGFIFWQFMHKIWNKYCAAWWDKLWGKDVAQDATQKNDPRG